VVGAEDLNCIYKEIHGFIVKKFRKMHIFRPSSWMNREDSRERWKQPMAHCFNRIEILMTWLCRLPHLLPHAAGQFCPDDVFPRRSSTPAGARDGKAGVRCGDACRVDICAAFARLGEGPL
jgi:hypothetical protein